MKEKKPLLQKNNSKWIQLTSNFFMIKSKKKIKTSRTFSWGWMQFEKEPDASTCLAKFAAV